MSGTPFFGVEGVFVTEGLVKTITQRAGHFSTDTLTHSIPLSSHPTMSMARTIAEGTTVAIVSKRNRTTYQVKFRLIRRGEPFRLKSSVLLSLELAIGCEYDRWYRYDPQQTRLCPLECSPFREEENPPVAPSGALGAGSDNRDLLDGREENQSLTLVCSSFVNSHFVVCECEQDQIETLKGEVAGGELVDRLVQGSATFSSKTRFSQEKYVQRKKMKYEFFVLFKRPTTRLICESYHYRGATKPDCSIRYDALAQVLTLANVQAYARVALFDTVNGMVLAGVYERLQGEYGKIFRVYSGTSCNQNLHCATLLPCFRPRLSKRSRSRLQAEEERSRRAAAGAVSASGSGSSTDPDTSSSPLPSQRDVLDEFLVHIPCQYLFPESIVGQSPTGLPPPFVGGLEYDPRYTAVLRSEKVDSLIVASDSYNVSEVFLRLFPMLKPSGCFAVYSRFRKQLEDLMSIAKNQLLTTSLRMTDTFLREYQVLEKRTHPHVMMFAQSGYVLSGIRVIDRGHQ